MMQPEVIELNKELQCDLFLAFKVDLKELVFLDDGATQMEVELERNALSSRVANERIFKMEEQVKEKPWFVAEKTPYCSLFVAGAVDVASSVKIHGRKKCWCSRAALYSLAELHEDGKREDAGRKGVTPWRKKSRRSVSPRCKHHSTVRGGGFEPVTVLVVVVAW
eukprot:Gb_16869 [translate_table: standard]